MKLIKYYKRLFYMPLALLKGIFEIINTKARDIENQKRFPKAIIDPGSSFTSNVRIGEHSRICRGCIINHTTIGSYSYINFKTLIQYASIGNYCSISHGVKIGLGNHPTHLYSTSPIFYKIENPLKIKIIDVDYKFDEYKKITIGHDVWIGTNAIVMDGVKIGNGAVIAAGAVVTKDVPDYAIVGGIPAKVLKYRFESPKRKRLLLTKWWLKSAQEVLTMDL